MLDNVVLVEDLTLVALFEEFQLARRSAKPSPHSERAARVDFASINLHLVDIVGREEIVPGDLNARTLRLAFGRFAENHAAASIARAWSTWNQFYGFLVADEVV